MCGIAVIVSGVRLNLPSKVSQSSNHLPVAGKKEKFDVDDILIALRRRGPDSIGTSTVRVSPHLISSDYHQGSFESTSFVVTSELHFVGATLQLRGSDSVKQPISDSHGNVLVYNGEIFGGIDVSSHCNDGEVLMESLSNASNELNAVPAILSTIKGPWSLIFWQESSKTLWYGRDAFGRRSLLVHWPSLDDSRFILSSVSSYASGTHDASFWEELPCGIHSIQISSASSIIGQVRHHDWVNEKLLKLIEWERVFVEPPCDSQDNNISVMKSAQCVLNALRISVKLRSKIDRRLHDNTAPIAVLFSGGLDSMIIAALLNECLDPSYTIDLLNVSFDSEFAPDRISAKAGTKELMKIAPHRTWRLVEIDADLSQLENEMAHVMQLLEPSNTFMDLNIGTALWLAARGDGWVAKSSERLRYKSEAPIVLMGSGADEQCAGYGRHRTKYRNSRWAGLDEEMRVDIQRIWRRNMGRDDRCICDNGKEGRFPFLDEDVIETLLKVPLWEIANLDEPSGVGDKKILRLVANLIGLHETAVLPKRAIQFGSRIARESNRKNFGSNRAANLASAGTVKFNASPMI